MSTKAGRARVRRYVRSRGDCHFITDVVTAADAVVGTPIPGPCHTPEMRALADAMEQLRWHAAGIERGDRIIKKIAKEAPNDR